MGTGTWTFDTAAHEDFMAECLREIVDNMTRRKEEALAKIWAPPTLEEDPRLGEALDWYLENR